MKQPRFRIKLGHDGRFFWTLVSANGEPLAHSQGYATKEMARKGTRAARMAVLTARTEDVD